MELHDAAINHFKHTHGEVLPHWPQAFVMPLEATAGELHIGVSFGFESSRDLDVIGSFVKGLVVSLLLLYNIVRYMRRYGIQLRSILSVYVGSYFCVG
jgi:hypothetical protein